MKTAADSARDRQLPAGWTLLRPGTWTSQREQIRLSVHHSKVTRLYTATAWSDGFFFSNSHLHRLKTATEEADRLGVLLQLRLRPPSAPSQDRSRQDSPQHTDIKNRPELLCRACAALMYVCNQCQVLRCDCLACLCFQGGRNPNWGTVRVIKSQNCESAHTPADAADRALCARCEGMQLVDCDACRDAITSCPTCEGCGLMDCPQCDEPSTRAPCVQTNTCDAQR